jgi:4-amino-4-deoxy-L-arabinose transferase-like glycosyltransferase
MPAAHAATRPSFAWRPVFLVGLACVAVLLSLADRYGFHRDELYFIVAGHHPDWGYVDQPPFAPLYSAWVTSWLGLSPLAVRVLPAISTGVVICLSGAIAREYGGDARAQLLAAITIGLSAILGLGHLDSTATYDVLAWTVVTWLVVRLLAGADPRLWLAAGLAAGIGLQNKHLVVLLAVGLVIGLAVSRRWDVLRSAWAWAAVGLATLIWLPNLVWQALNGFPQLGMSGVVAGRSSFEDVLMILPFQFILAGPLLWPVFVAGLWWLLRSPAAVPWRPIGWAYLAVLAITMLVRGQLYYPAGLFPALAAAGGFVLDRWLAGGHRRLRAAATLAATAGSGAAIAIIMLPLVPPSSLEATPLPDIYPESAEQIGWPELVDTVSRAAADLPPDERERAVILTANYGEAGALTLLGSDLPPVYSGHNSFADWGPPPDSLDVVMLVGHWDPLRHAEDLGSCRRAATIRNTAGIRNQEWEAGVWICTQPRTPWSEIWDDIAFYG